MKRYVAMLIDIMLVLVYAGVLAFVTLSFVGDLSSMNELNSNLIGLLTMILPVSIYFFFFEYYFGYTFGKKVMGLKVFFEVKSIQSVLIRTVLFVTPWILGHAFVFRGFYSEWQGGSLIVLGVLTYGLLLLNFILIVFTKNHQGFHELLSKSYVK